ncbi:MAG: M60 family metallopeptidase [Tannerellaceae bacterium]|jgi:hypothetical protein|nr:M60 family metallopeptidase [Tannerellaceae bacterium]
MTLCLVLYAFAASAQIVTPYPETIELPQISGAEKERIRLGQGHKKYDRQPTGFYLENGKKIVVNLEMLTHPTDGAMPVITIGTLGFNIDGRARKDIRLKEGENTIDAGQHTGGLVYLSFVNDSEKDSQGRAKITFGTGSEHVRAPRYVYGVTTDAEFSEMMNTYTTPDVIFHSDYVVATATREVALEISVNEDKEKWMNDLHLLLAREDSIGGLDNSDLNPVHYRLKAGEIRYLLTANTSGSPHANSAGYTGYPHGSRRRYLTAFGPNNNSWMVGHEVGHQHQQPAYQIAGAGESTVNIYSYVAERAIAGESYARTPANRWKGAQDTYLKMPLSKRVYDMPDKELEAITGFNRDELRFMVWNQLFHLFGDDFYKRLHRVVREEKQIGGGADERRAYLIWKASQVTGYDLTDYFNHWGIRVTDSEVKSLLRARIYTALKKNRIEALPRPVEELLMVTSQQIPTWAPLPLKGITTSSPGDEVENRSAWTITTSLGGVPDATVGGDNPQNIIDGNQTTVFSFIKPGKTYDGITGPPDYSPYFVIDRNSTAGFNFFRYTHRTANNTSEFLRARRITCYGKNAEADEFVKITEPVAIDHTVNKDEIKATFEEVNYRFVKLVIDEWNTASGSTIQVAEFHVGKENKEDLLPPDPLKFKISVHAGEGVTTSFAGENLADEDTDFAPTFTLEQKSRKPVVTVDGDTVALDAPAGDVYTVRVPVINHRNVTISASSDAGIETVDTGRITVFPNPVRTGEPFTIRSEQPIDRLRIFTLSGRLVSDEKGAGHVIGKSVSKQGVHVIEVISGSNRNVSKILVHE